MKRQEKQRAKAERRAQKKLAKIAERDNPTPIDETPIEETPIDPAPADLEP